MIAGLLLVLGLAGGFVLGRRSKIRQDVSWLAGVRHGRRLERRSPAPDTSIPHHRHG